MTIYLILTLIIIAVVQMALGAFWYGNLAFGKLWAKINGADKYSKEELAVLEKSMIPFYGLQFLLSMWLGYVTIVFITITGLEPFFAAFAVWIGFLLPLTTQITIWGSTEKKYWLKQILVTGVYQLISVLVVAAVFYLSVMYFI